jgi:hypothetical protein
VVSSASSQSCLETVHQNAQAIKASTSKTIANNRFWICEGKSLFLYGSRNTIWLEDSAIISVNGDSNMIYALQGASVTISGQKNEVFYDQNAFFNDNGVATIVNICKPMKFDYSVAPSGGCDYWIGQEEITMDRSFSIYPNPANDLFYLNLSDISAQQFDVFIYDVRGRMMKALLLKSNELSEAVDVSALPVGMYTLQILDGNLVHRRTFMINR